MASSTTDPGGGPRQTTQRRWARTPARPSGPRLRPPPTASLRATSLGNSCDQNWGENRDRAQITARRLEELLEGLRAEDRRPQLPDACFERARFAAGCRFERTRFLGEAHFDGAQFCGGAWFLGAQFCGDAHFDDARFSHVADFRKVRFSGEADFRGVSAKQGLFREAQFFGEARFDKAGFSGLLDLQADFRRRSSMGAVGVTGPLVLNDAVFDEDVRLDATAQKLFCVGTRFSARTDLNVCSAEITLEQATFAYRSRLAGLTPLPRGPTRSSLRNGGRNRNPTSGSSALTSGAIRVFCRSNGRTWRTSACTTWT